MIVINLLAHIGRLFLDFLAASGRLAIFGGRSISHVFRPPFFPLITLQQMISIGYFSLPVVGLTTLFTGMALALQIFEGTARFNAEGAVAQVVAIGMARELAPVLGGLMVAGRVGAAMAAEIGTMRVTEQIDALESMGINPIHHLVVPRVVAALLLIPTLTIMADFMGIFGGFAYSYLALDVDPHLYFQHSRDFVSGWDLLTGLIKSLFFGCTIAIVSCYHGFHCQVGAKGVGRAATAAFVISFVLILGVDLLLGLGIDRLFLPLRTGGNSLL